MRIVGMKNHLTPLRSENNMCAVRFTCTSYDRVRWVLLTKTNNPSNLVPDSEIKLKEFNCYLSKYMVSES